MPALPSDIRSAFEKEVISARDIAEKAAGVALTTLAVAQERPLATMNEAQKRLRRALRARARQLGGGDMEAGRPRLVEEIAYEQWHRMLFARFLAENNLLMHPEGVAVTLAECAELAPAEGAEDMWDLATRYAGAMLPGIFLIDDPAVTIRFAPEWRHRLERNVTGLPRLVFTADDSLGWAYQFWQSKKKDEVNASERKIGGADIAPVTQLFTEDYMVKFLLHNSLGAWWASRHPDSPLVATFDYLRFRDETDPQSPIPNLQSPLPAAGTFDGWPDRVAEVTVMDPCGGSGHFIVAAFEMLYRMRMEEEGLSAEEAGDAVIRDNLFMLELDPRCTQIAAFNLALAAWKSGGYRELPLPNIACSGIPVAGQLEDWLKLAGHSYELQVTLERLYDLFKNAPDFGSLINPADIPLQDRIFVGDYEKVEPLLENLLKQDHQLSDPTAALFGETLTGIARAAKLLAKRYTLVATNVPYLARGKQDKFLRAFCEKHYSEGKNDLATAFLGRCLGFCVTGGVTSVVLPQNWLFLTGYHKFRKKLLKNGTWHLIARLGPGAFETISGEVVKAILIIIGRYKAPPHYLIHGLDVSEPRTAMEKAVQLVTAGITQVEQRKQLENPDVRITMTQSTSDELLEEYAMCSSGMLTGDSSRFYRFFWEINQLTSDWEFLQSTVSESIYYGGRSQVVYWQQGTGELYQLAESLKHLNHAVQNWRRGQEVWNKSGIAVSSMGNLPCSLYDGDFFDNNTAVIIPKDPAHLPALWAFCKSSAFNEEVRRLDQKVNVTTTTLIKIPFDLQKWSKIAEKASRLPEPHSNDPTQWLFEGHPIDSTDPLQVAVARLLGQRWPQQDDRDEMDHLADEDGIVCLPAVAGEPPAHERLRQLLAAAYAHFWMLPLQQKLLENVGYGGKSLAAWLRDGFFQQHCRLFKNRPFIWHVWDGRKDGFSALVNYHKLDAARLDKLIYTYLGTWINDRRAEVENGVAGAEGRLVAALALKEKLELIREGEPPYDIYVRWKPLHQQPIGWNPDLNDGVRLNIRPFVTAGVLRSRFTIHWKKDRGKNPDGSERLNDLHFTRAEKEGA